MRVYCAWCQMEGEPGYLGEKEPLEEPGDTHGICTLHASQTLSHLAFRGSIHSGAPDLVDAREHLDRWAEESRHVLGRLIPDILERNERLLARAARAEEDAERMRQEIAGLREELSNLRSDNAHLRTKQVELMHAFGKASDQIHDILGTLVSRQD